MQYLLTQYLFLFDHHLPGYLRKLDFRCSGESPILSSSTQHSWCLPALLCAKEPGLGNNHLNTNALRDSSWESIIGKKKKRIWHNIASNQRNENQNINLAKIKKILSSADQFVVKGSILIYCGRNVKQNMHLGSDVCVLYMCIFWLMIQEASVHRRICSRVFLPVLFVLLSSVPGEFLPRINSSLAGSFPSNLDYTPSPTTYVKQQASSLPLVSGAPYNSQYSVADCYFTSLCVCSLSQ